MRQALVFAVIAAIGLSTGLTLAASGKPRQRHTHDHRGTRSEQVVTTTTPGDPTTGTTTSTTTDTTTTGTTTTGTTTTGTTTTGSTTPTPPTTTSPPPSGGTLIFDDEFDGTTLDSSKWTPNWLYNSCPSCVTKPVNSRERGAYDPKQVSVHDGALYLTAIASPATVNGVTYPYRSGLIQSDGKFQFTYGRLEARIYLPSMNGRIANWPAFWTDGQHWPNDGENDVMEGLEGDACWHFHSTAGGPGNCASGDFSGWHTYAATWSPGKVSYFYDGAHVGDITTGITGSPMYLIVNYGISDYPSWTATPNTMAVDYVRFWSS
jgi:beta-glucanase (GH16 family)